MSDDLVNLVAEVCAALSRGVETDAGELLRKWPSDPPVQAREKITERTAMQVFMRDGFLDRYSGRRLVNPGVLRLISLRLQDQFRFHEHWKSSESHPAYWQLSPTIDHIVPLARGGAHVSENFVTTAMLRNAANANWTLEELDWSLHPAGDLKKWDGLTGWLLAEVERSSQWQNNRAVTKWARLSNPSAH